MCSFSPSIKITMKNMSDIRIYKKKKKNTPGASSSKRTLKEGQIDRETKRGRDNGTYGYSDNLRLITWMVTLVNVNIWNIHLEEFVCIWARSFLPPSLSKVSSHLLMNFQSLHLIHCQYLHFFALQRSVAILFTSGVKLNSWRAAALQSLAPTSSNSHLLGSF